MNEQYFTELNGYLVKDNKSVHFYDTVASMKTDTKLKSGMYVKTKGYYSINDGGSAEYYIRTKTGTDVEDNGSIHFIGTLVAELIPQNNIINIKQFGAKGDGETDDTLSFQNAFNNINDKVLYIDNNTYLVDDTLTINNKSNFTIKCNGILHSKSSDIHEKDTILISNSSNFKVDGLYITSTLDKTELAPADHVRQNYTGSNRLGIKLSNCQDCILDNIVTENMAQDIKINKPEGITGNYPNSNIYINNWKSINSSMCFLSLFSKDIYINNADVNLKNELGDGNHFFYIERYCKNIYINEITANVEDTYIKYGFNIYEGSVGTEESAPKEIYVNKCNMKAPSFLALHKYSTFYCKNVEFEGFNSLAENSNFFIISIANGNYNKLKINDSIFNNFKTPFIYLYSTKNDNIEINNSKISNYSDTYDQYLIATGNTNCSNNEIIIKDSLLNIKSLNYINSNTENCNVYLYNNIIKSMASNWLFSVRNTNNIVFSSNNIITFDNTIPKVIFNGGTTDSPGFTLLNTYINNSTILGFNVEIASLVKLNSYLNGTLIS